MVATWVFHIFTCEGLPRPEEATSEQWQSSYDRYVELAASCEEWGIDGVFWAEHHFSSLLLAPSPHLLVAAVAQRTRFLRFGVLGSVLALHDARRFAEECAMLDYLTNGRFEPGIAPGAGYAEAAMVGLPRAIVRPRYLSGAELFRKALEEVSVTHRDEFYDLDATPIIPRMRADPSPRVWTTVMSPESAVYAAERGWGMCTAWQSQEKVSALADAYRAGELRAGREPDASRLALRRRVLVAPSDAEAEELAAASEDVMVALRRQKGGAFEAADPQVASAIEHADDIVVGGPERVAERLIAQCRQGGFGRIVAWTDFRVFPPSVLEASHRLLGGAVAPLLKQAELGSGAPPASDQRGSEDLVGMEDRTR